MKNINDILREFDEKLTEKLAAIEHERWGDWQDYVHSQCRMLPNGDLMIPRDLVWRWNKQIKTRYSNLSEPEKESDREQVRRYAKLIKSFLCEAVRKSFEAVLEVGMPNKEHNADYVMGWMDCELFYEKRCDAFNLEL